MKINEVDFQRIAKAIIYLRDHVQDQPSLETLAQQINVSPYHFQRMFTSWAGVSPKQFQKYLNIRKAKELLQKQSSSLFQASNEVGLSGTGRLHDLFITLEKMTPGEYKKRGQSLILEYSFKDTPFGKVLIASTKRGICHISFVENESKEPLQTEFPDAILDFRASSSHEKVLQFFNKDLNENARLNLHLKGTDFQLKVWEALLKIPAGRLSTYGAIASDIGKPGASRAVGSAIGSNPIAYLIPCHRVIQNSGVIGGYKWNPERKSAIIGWEVAKNEFSNQ